MAYWWDRFCFPDSIEHEYKWAGNYGAKGEKRAQRSKATPEQIKKQNQKNKEKYVRRLIKANFTVEDLWVTLKYPKGTRNPLSEVQKDFGNFISRLKRAYKKQDAELKYIYRLEIGKQGGIHIHMIANRIRDSDLLLKQKWTFGRVHLEGLYEEGGYEDLAAYLVKEPDEGQEKQLSLFPEEDRKALIKYSTSRNLIRPEPERKIYSRRTVRKLIENGPVPTPGFYIDKNSVVSGINPYTGMSYLHYTEVRLKKRGSPGKEKKVEEINLYIQTSIKGIKKQEGFYCYVLEMMVDGQPRTRTGVEKLPSESGKLRAELIALKAALERMRRPCKITIFLEDETIKAAYENKWIDMWQQSGWINTKNQPVANKEEWQKVVELLSQHEFSFQVKKKHSYREWMQGELERKEKGEKEHV